MDERTEHEEFEQLLSGRSGFAEGELAKLASLARALERTRPAPAAPRSEFREALRTKLLEESRTAVVIPLPLYARIRASIAVRDAKMRRSFRLVVATAAAVMMLLVSGAAFAASSDSLPGQALYPMKRAREGMQLAFTFGALPKAQKQLGFARERLDEVRALADAGELDTSRYISTLKDMDARTADATSLLITAFRHDKDSSILTTLIDFSAAQRQSLETMVNAMPPGARPAARGSIEVLVAVQDRVSSVLGGCPCSSDIFTPASTVPGGPAACTCSSTRNDANGVPTRPQAEPTTRPTSAPSPTPTPTTSPSPSPSPSPGPVEQVQDAVNQLLNGLLPTPTPLPSTPALP